MDSFSFECRGCTRMKELEVELEPLRLLVVAVVGSSPQPDRRLRGGKVTGRRETGRKETGQRETGRKEIGHRETG